MSSNSVDCSNMTVLCEKLSVDVLMIKVTDGARSPISLSSRHGLMADDAQQATLDLLALSLAPGFFGTGGSADEDGCRGWRCLTV